MTMFFGSFALFILLGVPIALSLGIACMALLWASDNFHLMSAFPRYMAAGLDQFLLLSIPLFVLTGSLMSRGRITERIVLFAQALVGRVPGGLSMVSVTTCMFFGSAATATSEAAAVGSVMIPAMDRSGYPRDYAAALVAVASVMGSIIPPAISMIIFGALTGTSIASLFLAGIAPGVMIGVGLMGYAYWQAIRHRYPVSEPMAWGDRLRAVAGAFPAAMLPVIILGGILSGIFTPTESAGVAVIYALFLSGVVYRHLTFRDIYDSLWETAFLTAGIMIVVAMANMVSFVFAIEGVADGIARTMLGISENKFVLLLLINVVLLLLGMFLEPISIMILILPVLTLVGSNIGIDPVHLGAIVVLNVVIGLVTPPVGLCLFITSAISHVRIEDISRKALPMIGICLAVLAIVTYVPEIPLFLPSLYDTYR
ncbi:TRAP transporter large permease [Microbaculum marinum]|uniref:TRAP transporter large permease protein n=1 Tax=Microbaculum marinum TaxID=1764581 RepID=A0AAW9RT38_9HYPH